MTHAIKISKDLSEIIKKIINLDELLNKVIVKSNSNGIYLVNQSYMNEILFYVKDIEFSSKKLEDEEIVILKYLIGDIYDKLIDLCSYLESKERLAYISPDYRSILSVCESIKSTIYKFK